MIVVSDGDESRLGSVLNGILERADGLDLDAVVVDPAGGSSAEYVERNFMGVRTIRCAERGLGQARNRALETADARYVLFADPRLEICGGSLRTLVSALDSRPGVALADALGLAAVPGVRRVLGERELDPGRYAQARPCEWTSGPMLVRSSALQWVGWFDERLFQLAAEMDLCQRLRRAGWRSSTSPASHRPAARAASAGGGAAGVPGRLRADAVRPQALPPPGRRLPLRAHRPLRAAPRPLRALAGPRRLASPGGPRGPVDYVHGSRAAHRALGAVNWGSHLTRSAALPEQSERPQPHRRDLRGRRIAIETCLNRVDTRFAHVDDQPHTWRRCYLPICGSGQTLRVLRRR